MNDDAYREGIKLFNHREFFEAHEVLEDVWRAAHLQGPEKKFLQALIQIAVALHHHSRGNLIGARSLLARATRNLEKYPETFGGIRLKPLRKLLIAWANALAENGPPPPHFKIKIQPSAVSRRSSATKES